MSETKIVRKGKLGTGVTFEYPLGGAAYWCDSHMTTKEVTCKKCRGRGRRFFTFPEGESTHCGECYGNKTIVEDDKMIFTVHEITINAIDVSIQEGSNFVDITYCEGRSGGTLHRSEDLFKTEEAAIKSGEAKGWLYDPDHQAFSEE